jgi:phosphatidylethanolamine/phosphatidyl-N-methylethanolamine N-methyltransferase
VKQNLLINQASNKFKRGVSFFKEVRKNFTELGQVAPSSKDLSKRMTAPLREINGQRRILEVGPGTGVVTKQIVKLLRAGDELVICEINPRLLTMVENKISKQIAGKEFSVKFVCSPVQDLKDQYSDGYFDAIISSLPFTNFPPQLVSEVLILYKRLLKTSGVLTFYEYLALRKMGQMFRGQTERRRVGEVSKVLSSWERELYNRKQLSQSVSFLNLPPARVMVASLGEQ